MTATVGDIVARHMASEGPLLPILNDVQAAFGHVSEDAIRTIADLLNLTRAEVHGVVSFYHDYRDRPEPRPVIKLCRAEACQARGGDALAAWAAAKARERIAIEPVYCLGLCSVGPAAMIGDRVYGRLDTETLHQLIAAL